MMKLKITLLFLLGWCVGFAQCIPDSLVTAPGVYPVSDSIPCIVQGQQYNATLSFKIDTSNGFPGILDSITVISATNLPCGISWMTDKSYTIQGELGCIQLLGITNDTIGQYEVQVVFQRVYYGYIAGIGVPAYTDTLMLRKDLRIKNSIGTCPEIDTSTKSAVSSCNPFLLKSNRSSSLVTVISGKDTICSGDTTLLIATTTGNAGNVKYKWSPAISLSCDSCDSVYANPDTTITYTLIARDSLGNSDTTQITLVVNSLLIPNVKILPEGDTNYLTEIDTNYYIICPYVLKTALPARYFVAYPVNGGIQPTYNWQINGYTINFTTDTLDISALEDSFYFSVHSASYDSIINSHALFYSLTCQMTSSLTGCITNSIVTSKVDTLSVFCEGLNSLSINNSINISPNPNTGIFLLSINQPSQELNIELLNIQGQKMYSEQLKDLPSYSKEYNFSDLAKGVYLLRVVTENGIVVKRVVVQ